jgi:hypothetical protein
MNGVANEILKQLGGNRFVVMTGAKELSASANTLSFRFSGSKDYNHCRIRLDPKDWYIVTFTQIWGLLEVNSTSYDMIYADGLAPLFTRVTGLHTSL